MKNIIEICATNIQSALAAQEGGAQRIELCDNLYEGGTTPSCATIKKAKELLNIPINVMIRPRGGDFLYNDMEFDVMWEDISICKEMGIHGVVFGLLLPDGNIDIKRTRQLVNYAQPLSITFHRAFDMTPDPYSALEQLIDCGINRLLTSGQKNKVTEGKDLIRSLIQKADGRIIIMPGSGINENNIKEIRDFTGAKEFHLTGRKLAESNMKFRKNDIFMGGLPQIPEYGIYTTDVHLVKNMVRLVNEV